MGNKNKAARKLVNHYLDSSYATTASQRLDVAMEMAASNEAIEILLQTPRIGGVFHPTHHFATGLIISAHPSPWAVAVPEDPSQSMAPSLQHILGIWHRLTLDPSHKPNIPWLDRQLRQMLAPRTEKSLHIDNFGAYYQVLLCLIANQVSYDPSNRFTTALDQYASRFDAECQMGAAITPPLHHAANILSHLGHLSPLQRARLGKTLPSTAQPVEPTVLPQVDFMSSWRHLGYPSMDLVARAELASDPAPVLSTRTARARLPYHLVPLLSRNSRIVCLTNPSMAAVAPLLFALPAYAPAQFVGLPLSTWSQVLAKADAPVRKLLVPLCAAVQQLAQLDPSISSAEHTENPLSPQTPSRHGAQ